MKTIKTFTILSAFVLCTSLSALAQCDGLPHPENGQPAPCFQNPTLPNGQDGQLRQEHQQEQEREQQLKDQQYQNCQSRAQNDYQQCLLNNPNGYCQLANCE